MMLWLKNHPFTWRLAALALLLAALLGPWGYDRINVPAQYDCSPYIRLAGDFCGLRISGVNAISAVVGAVFSIVVALISGAVETPVSIGSLFSGLLYLVPVFLIELPILSTLLLMLCGDRLALKILQVTAWILALGIALFLGYHSYPTQIQHYWGVWLYIAAGTSACVLEGVTWVRGSGGRLKATAPLD
jgi:hypothetical protein